jgi:hypothetical protein
MSGFRTPRPVAVNALFAALTIAWLLAGCGGSSAALPTVAGGVQGSASDASPGASPPASAASTDPSVAWPAWAACLRSHSLVVADPSIDQDGQPQFAPGLDLEHLVTPAMHADCDPLIQSLTANKGGGATYTFDSLVAFAGCLRQHGLPAYPDPDPNGVQGLAPGYDKGDPAVSAAIDACHDLLVRSGDAPTATP